jgi:hypothetical protein
MFTRQRTILFTLVAMTVAAAGCTTRDLTTPRAEAETRTSRSQTDNVTIAAVGDIMLGSTSINETFLPPNDGRDLLAPMADVLSSADITFGNLEGPMLEGGKNEKCPPITPPKPGEAPKPVRCFAFRVPTRYGKYLKDAGFDVLSLANNHAFDFGDQGRISTRRVLDELGIKHAGSDKERYATTVLEVRGSKIAFVGFAHNAITPNVNDLGFARQLVTAAAKKADIVVVSFHGGAEGSGAERVPKQTELFVGEKRGNLPLFAKTVIDAGADLVLGHGPHVLRGMEIYKKRLVVYSMGNFATYGMFNLRGPQGLTAVFEVTIAPDGEFVSGKIHPAKQLGRGGPVPDPAGEAIKKIRSLSQLDFPASAPAIAADGTFTPRQ